MGPVIKLPFIVEWEANLQKKNLSPKRKPDTLAISRRKSNDIEIGQKKTNSPKENQSPIYLPTLIGSTII